MSNTVINIYHSKIDTIWVRILAVLKSLGILLLALTLVSCSTSSSESADNSVDEPSSNQEKDRIRFALDWSPNSNHTALFVAEALGLFDDENLIVDIVEYENSGVPEVLENGHADFGIVDQTAVHVSRAAGFDLVSVFQVTQKETGRIIFLPNREDIQRPSDLDHKKFGGFDSPLYAGIAAAVIRGDGGEGLFEDITLNTGTYEALENGSVDFTLSVATWEDLKAERAGNPFGSFRYQDFGMPDVHTIGIATTAEFIAENHDITQRFIRAIQKGQEFAIENPQEASGMFLQITGDSLAGEEELLQASIQMMATEGYFKHPQREVGEASEEIWDEYGQFLIALGLLYDEDGQIITESMNWDEAFTNRFVEK